MYKKYCSDDDILWSYIDEIIKYDVNEDILYLKPHVIQYPHINIVANTNKCEITICIRFDREHDCVRLIDMFVTDPDDNYEKEPCAYLVGWDEVYFMLSLNMNKINACHKKLHKAVISANSKPLNLIQLQKIVSNV
uniref:Uncharacterized protein n=1 Tax=Pithovirus LCPAC001 TaxID=2506585 RepID=A0A481Z2H8_9VIRU|nr:MAG: hypothetical protein LCPAC001_00090 [Pithovirus LCPAC001]